MRIALSHAVAVAMAPIEDAFRAAWPEAGRMNLFDDALSVGRTGTDDIDTPITRRIRMLADYAVAAGANGNLYTFSAFGPARQWRACASASPPDRIAAARANRPGTARFA